MRNSIVISILVAAIAAIESTGLINPRAYVPPAGAGTPASPPAANGGNSRANGNGNGKSSKSNTQWKDSNANPDNFIGLDDTVLLYFINSMRRRHSVGPVQIDATLTRKARECANNYALSKEMMSNAVGDLDRLASLTPFCPDLDDAVDYPHTGGNTGPDIVAMLNRWYVEKDRGGSMGPQAGMPIPPYNYQNPNMTFKNSYQHFTQLVWKDTTKVGCATSTSPNKADVRMPPLDNNNNNNGQNPPPCQYVTVCIFSPGGNLVPSGNRPQYYLDNVFDVKAEFKNKQQ